MGKPPALCIVILVFLCTTCRSQITPSPIQKLYTYSVPSFNASHEKDFSRSGNASIDTTGAVQLTPDSSNSASFRLNKSGRFMFKKKFKMWEEAPNINSSDVVVSFNSSFLVNFYVPPNGNEKSGEGFAFLIGPDRDFFPNNSQGEWLGLTNASLNGNSSNRFVAIEFDTKKQDYDIDDNHIGLDINGVQSIKSVSLTPLNIRLAPLDLVDGIKYMVWVEYNGSTRLLQVFIDYENYTRKPTSPVLNETIDLKDYVNQYSYLGFSAATGNSTGQLNCLLQWNLSMEILLEDKSSWWKVVVGLGVVVLVLVIGGVIWLIRYYKKKNADDLNFEVEMTRLPGTPKEFKFRDLKKATNNFSDKMKLGQGGFGVVYRGVLPKENTEVAVKRFSRESMKGRADFMAELVIINRLRHKHLVPLIGWCHRQGMLLLVYEYMPNGSVDNHLFGGPDKFLSWGIRYNIISGLASALHYLHNEFDQMVVHRDLKSSNILLDSDYNTRLGDFGLARALDHGKTSYAELTGQGVPGTFGYIAPETFHAGKATRESDVYAFGAVVLEVVCGQHPSTKVSGSLAMVDWVWKLYREDRILDAVDKRMKGEFVEKEAERLVLLGLACCHRNASERPKAQLIVQIVSGSVPVPDVPRFQPYFMWPQVGSIEDSSMSNTADTIPITSSYDDHSGQYVSNENFAGYITIATTR
ncbi:hypothetical protein ACHQM5_015771 [Ranunculus cassubicifolius]